MFDQNENPVFDNGVGEPALPDHRTVGDLFAGRRLSEDTAPAPWTVFRQSVRDNSTDWRFTPGYIPESEAMNGAMGHDLHQLATEVAENIRAQQKINDRAAMSKTFLGLMTGLLFLLVLLSLLK